MKINQKSATAKSLRSGLIALTALWLVACVSSPAQHQTTQLIEHPQRMLWEIQGPKGKVYILGTIHALFADSEAVESSTMKLFQNADRVYAEISYTDLLTLPATVMKYVQNDTAKEGKYADITKFLSDDENKTLQSVLGKAGIEKMKGAKPWIFNTLLTTFILQKNAADFGAGVDMQLYKYANTHNIVVEGLEKAQAQIDFLRMGTYEEQLSQLKPTLASFKTPHKVVQALSELISAYTANDKAGLSKIVLKTTESEFNDTVFKTKYIEKLFKDRNKQWALKIAELLEMDGTTFIFAGAGHFAIYPTVFDFMEKNGTLIQTHNKEGQ